jgi:hypothetical protein
MSGFLDEGYLQAERGELIEGEQALGAELW